MVPFRKIKNFYWVVAKTIAAGIASLHAKEYFISM